jgi:hypothetical protein
LEKLEEDILAREQSDFFSNVSPSSLPVLDSRPEIFPDLLWIWEGFMCLSMSRQYGMSSPQRISMSEVNAYCEFKELFDPDDRDDFLYHVQKLDSVFMKDWLAKNPTKGKGGKPERLGSL